MARELLSDGDKQAITDVRLFDRFEILRELKQLSELEEPPR